MNAEELIGHREASRRYGISVPTIARRVREGQLEVFVRPIDRRRRLIRVTDLERLMEPHPAQLRSETAASAA
jgi:excisionase family DNA binding protein